MHNNNKQLSSWLALWNVPGIGSRKFKKIISKFSDISAVFTATNTQLSEVGCNEALSQQLRTPNWQQVEQILRWQEQPGNSIMTWQDLDYPKLLNEVVDAPPILYIRGQRSTLTTPQLAIVGSRNPSHLGTENAFNFAQELAKQGFTITSGLARGIDVAAHRGALARGGKTLAVIGSGVDIIYPHQHVTIAEAISQNGAIISEYPLGILPKAQHFPRRNRIISGLSLGVLVVEAALKSGSLITAHAAIEQGRDVFAIPGSIQNPAAKGCHALIRQGAKLVETVADIFEELPAMAEFFCSAKAEQNTIGQIKTLDNEANMLIECMGSEVTSIDTLLIRCGLTPEIVLSKLLVLELQGIVLAVPGGYMRKRGFE